ncbi:MAG: uncharacterized protein K0S00_3972 [Xanthobacteraceae bacterium]|jgi:Zn-dependent peptidase ImmA (M78 family)/transcriptional regulator with XRE-family HTH domain|nr:uncharacterized protein [Xanthobacteraceae bacterium]
MSLSSNLKQIREKRRLDRKDVASFTHISDDRLAQFESGERAPTYLQIERLSHVYGVASYLLAGTGTPNVQETIPDFRRTQAAPARLSARGITKIWAAEEICQYSNQLGAALDVERPNWADKVAKQKASRRSAAEIRSFFNDWLLKRERGLELSGPPDVKFFTAFRLFIESIGVIVNVTDAPESDFIGFYLKTESRFDSIFVNRSVTSKKAQLFTLAHEFAHYLEGAEGISDPFRAKNALERKCNQFAAEFIAPEQEFTKIAAAIPRIIRNDFGAFVHAVSAKTLLSRQAAAIRLYEVGLASPSVLASWQALTRRSYQDEKAEEGSETTSSFGVPHAKRLSELGYMPAYLSNLGVERRIIDGLDVERGLNLSGGLQERAFSLAARRLTAAMQDDDRWR